MSPPSAPDPDTTRLVVCAGATLAVAALVYRATRARCCAARGRGALHEVVTSQKAAGAGGGVGLRARRAATLDGRRLDCLLRRLDAARRSLDVCVTVLTSCPDLSGALLAALFGAACVFASCSTRRYVDVHGQPAGGAAPLWRARVRQAAAITCASSSPWSMTRCWCAARQLDPHQAALGNSENVIITNNPALVRPYVGEFKNCGRCGTDDGISGEGRSNGGAGTGDSGVRQTGTQTVMQWQLDLTQEHRFVDT